MGWGAWLVSNLPSDWIFRPTEESSIVQLGQGGELKLYYYCYYNHKDDDDDDDGDDDDDDDYYYFISWGRYFEVTSQFLPPTIFHPFWPTEESEMRNKI